jgi:hypothetical protein
MPPAGRSDSERPLLSGGERLREEIDRAGGGAPKYHPQSLAEARDILRPQVEMLRTTAVMMPAELRGERLIFEATLLPNYLANSYFPRALLDDAGLVAVGTRPSAAPYRTPAGEREAQPTKALVLAASDRALDRLAAIFDAPAERLGRSVREAIQEFASFALPKPEEIIHVTTPEAVSDAAALVTFESVLHPSVPQSGWARVTADGDFEKWSAWIAQLGGTVIADYRRSIEGLTFVPVRLSPERLLEAARFNPLRAIRPMPQMRPVPVTVMRSATELRAPIPPPPGEGPRSDISVAIFDGGTDLACPILRPFVTQVDLTREASDDQFVSHGTAVTSAALFGEATPGGQLPVPDAHVDHYRVLPPPPDPHDVDLYWILDRIVETVERNDYDIVNLSLGPDLAIDDGDPHRWTAEIDRLSREHGVLFVTAVGNNGEADAAVGLNRVQVPSDAVNGLGVGACGERDPASWRRAAYSAVGPGRAGARVQPVGLAFGGSDGEPYLAMIGRGRWAETAGTSYATPVTVNGLVGLGASLGRPRATPNNLRVFAAHFANRLTDHEVLEAGYGRFRERYEDAWMCDSNEVTLLYEDQLDRDQMVALVLPVPDGALDGMNVELRWTLAFTSPTDPTDAVDYTRAGIEIQFRPHARRYTFTQPGRSEVEGPLDTQEQAAEVSALLRAGWHPSTHPATRPPGSARLIEAQLREGGKWETMVQLTHHMRGTGLFRPRLDLSFLARDSGSLIRDAVPPLEYSLLVTIRGRSGIDLYDRVRTEYAVLTPLVAQVPLQIRI